MKEMNKCIINKQEIETVVANTDITSEYECEFISCEHTIIKKLRGFEVVDDEFRKYPSETIILPSRGTSKAMAYDFYSPIDLVIEPNKIGKVWTDIKAYMLDNEGLILNVRSSMGGKVMLANTSGWIDGDYYSNEGNDGNIGIFLLNISDEPYVIKKGDRVAQGMFINYLVSDNGNTDKVRTGGFGSTNK